MKKTLTEEQKLAAKRIFRKVLIGAAVATTAVVLIQLASKGTEEEETLTDEEALELLGSN